MIPVDLARSILLSDQIGLHRGKEYERASASRHLRGLAKQGEMVMLLAAAGMNYVVAR